MEVSALLSRYLLASSAEQALLRDAHADIFGEDVVDALTEAKALLRETQHAARAACDAVDGTVGALGLPAALCVADTDRRALGLTDEAMADRFAEQIALLLRRAWSEAAEAVPPPPQQQQLWHRQRSIVLEALSFLPVEEALGAAENVCGLWRQWLRDTEAARPFWTGCVQREFPRHLRALVESEGAGLLEADWRTIAMLCCIAEDEAEEVDHA